MMAEYIDRSVAIARITALEVTEPRATMTDVKRVLADMPSADVAPVRHGRWLTWEEMFPGETPKKKNNLGVFCRVCKNHADNMSGFCPNCGARMDGEDKHETD